MLADIAAKEDACPAPRLKADSLVPHYTYDGASGDLTDRLESWSGIPYGYTQTRLMTMNDGGGLTFSQIADWIEENL